MQINEKISQSPHPGKESFGSTYPLNAYAAFSIAEAHRETWWMSHRTLMLRAPHFYPDRRQTIESFVVLEKLGS